MGERGSRPLAGKRVIVTRAAEQGQPVVEALRAAGAEAIVIPLVAFAPPDDFAPLDRFLNGNEPFDWTFFTSQNALRALQERCATLGKRLPSVLSGSKVAAIGAATAEILRGAGLRVDHVSSGRTGVALADELAAEVKGKKIFLPRSDKANPDLLAALDRHGAFSLPVIAYKTVSSVDAGELRESLLAAHADAALFFSPSAAHHLREVLGADAFQELNRQSVFAAIGPISEKALREEGAARVLVAKDTSVEAAVDALAEFFSKAGQHEPAGAKRG